MTGKKLGIIAFIFSILFVICIIISWIQMPEIPDEYYDLMMTDSEQAIEMILEIEENAPVLYKIASKLNPIFGLGGIILAIVSLVKMNKANEKGKIFATLALAIIFGAFIVDFVASFAEGFKMGLEAAQ